MNGLLRRSANLKTPLAIIYINKSNHISQRIIRVLKVEDSLIKAYCYTKKQIRTFRLDNILSVDVLRKRMGA
ncbi:putative DNA-binding transcriptional regulator YafY [Bacillus thermophilus]|uniref:DNA-binding transcriptional regulator YafY n=1 Tax=Siminovitchia thermophila TaxID=1245522 RepID=A0ABS2R854_9BACI|nr:putative DNA-binding transcriptional regulator YafY [Siminovitchia thermophila]